MSKHSPGPWTTDRDRAKSVSLYSGKTFVGEIYCEADEPSAEELANVKLVADAPELFAYRRKTEPALRRIYDLLYFDNGAYDPDKEWDSMTLEAIAAVMKDVMGEPKAGAKDWPTIVGGRRKGTP
jgi:hypothetical protein